MSPSEYLDSIDSSDSIFHSPAENADSPAENAEPGDSADVAAPAAVVGASIADVPGEGISAAVLTSGESAVAVPGGGSVPFVKEVPTAATVGAGIDDAVPAGARSASSASTEGVQGLLEYGDRLWRGGSDEVLPSADYVTGLFSRLLPVPFVILNAKGEILKRCGGGVEQDRWNILGSDPRLLQQISAEIAAQKIALITAERPVIYGGVHLPKGVQLIFGPVVISRTEHAFAKLYALKHHADNCVLMLCAPSRLCSVLLLIYAALYGECISLSAFMDRYFLTSTVENMEHSSARVLEHSLSDSRPHNPGIFEKQIREAIIAGDHEALLKAMDSPYASMRGNIGHTPLRCAQNLGVVDITLATRAAIEAGLSVEEMYILADAFILETEDCRYPEEAASLARVCALRCANMVANYKQNHREDSSSVLVFKARDYVDRHVSEKIEVSDIAASLKVSPGYLMHCFHAEEHITLARYIRKRKVEIAKMMLKNPDNSIADIAGLLSFKSQSHFGKIFAAECGTTPARYRKAYLLRHF